MLTHRRQNAELNSFVILFAEKNNEHYGDHVWTLETELPEIDSKIIEIAADFFEVDLDEAAELVNPENIVDSAGAWDDASFVEHIGAMVEYGQVEAGYKTNDGAVVLDRDAIKMTYSFED